MQAVQTLVDALTAEFAAGPCGEPRDRARISELLAAFGREPEAWRRYALFSEERYTRNLIARTDAYELLLLCWGAGQESPIHNHEGNDCWMAVLEGRIEEIRYDMPSPGQTGPLDRKADKVYAPPGVAFIRDEMGLHLVRGADGQAGISLHLYASPYDACNLYCPETGTVERVTLSNHSENGVVLGA